MNHEEILRKKLQDRRESLTFRSLPRSNTFVDFSSNDYLGLSRNQTLLDLIDQEYHKTNRAFGSGGSRLLAGDHDFFHELEDFLAVLHKGEASLLFNSGYAANQAFFATIPQRGDTVIYDSLIHACVKDGLRLGLANHFSFKHNNLDHLKSKLTNAQGNVFVAVESVYSMDGDEAPLKELVKICEEYNAALVIDEAHSSGIYGTNGAGLVEQLGIQNRVFARIHTFGKAIGAHGACIVGSQLLKDYLINFSRQFIYTTSAPIHSLVAIYEAYKFIQGNRGTNKELFENIDLFKSLLKIETGSNSPIQPVIVSGNNRVKSLASKIQSNEIDVRPVLNPTVAKGAERLRVCIHSHNTKEEIKALVSLINAEV